MEDELTDEETDEDLTLSPQEAGLAFKAEMWAMDTLLGYWPFLLGTIVVVLIAVFFYGQYDNYQTGQQRGGAKSVAQVEKDLPERVGMLAFQQFAGEKVDVGEVVAAATRLEGLEVSGPAKGEALMKAAELYRIAEKPEEQRRVLDGVTGLNLGVLSFTADLAIANLELEAGENDAAISRLKRLSAADDTYLGEQATLDLGLIYEQLGQKAEAVAVYDGFVKRWPESPRKEDAAKRKSRLGDG